MKEKKVYKNINEYNNKYFKLIILSYKIPIENKVKIFQKEC